MSRYMLVTLGVDEQWLPASQTAMTGPMLSSCCYVVMTLDGEAILGGAGVACAAS